MQVINNLELNCGNAKVGSKKTYQKPTLKVYGSVTVLTQTGSRSGSETGGTEDRKSGMQSDLLTKENITQVGTHPLGVGLYLFNYKPEFQVECGFGRYFGVMAQEVELVMPSAVSVAKNGYKQVDYSLLGIKQLGANQLSIKQTGIKLPLH